MAMSWRENASLEAQTELDELLNIAFDMAKAELDQRRELLPFALTVNKEGDVRAVISLPKGELGNSSSTDFISAAVETLCERRDDLSSTAIVSDVITDKGTAIRAQLEHKEGIALSVFLHYKSRRVAKPLVYGELTVSADLRRIWNDVEDCA